MSNKKKSKVWNYFTINPNNPKVTICQVKKPNNEQCNKSMSYKSTSTSAMVRHLKSQHQIFIDKSVIEINLQVPTILQLPPRQNTKSLGEILAQCAAIDGMPIDMIRNSVIIKDYLTKVHHYQMPVTDREIKEQIFKFHDEAINEYRNMFEHLKSNHIKFSITISPTSRTVDTNLHCLAVHYKMDSKIESINLGIIYWLLNTDQIGRRLRQFGLDLYSDVVACTYKREELCIEVINQFCIKQVIQNSVWCAVDLVDIPRWTLNLSEMFMFSEHNSTILQKCVLAGGGEKIECFDFNCKFSNLIRTKQIVDRIVKLQSHFKQAFKSGQLIFKDSHTKKVNYDESKFSELKHFSELLEPLIEAVIELDKSNSNLLTVEAVMKYVFMKLRLLDSDLSTKVVVELNFQFSFAQRRNTDLVSLMHFLKHRKYPTDGFENFTYASKHEIIKTANNLNHRLFGKNVSNQEDQLSNFNKFCNFSTLSAFVSDELRESKHDLTSHVELAEKTGTLSSPLERLYNALISIRPTAISSDRVLAGYSNIQMLNKSGYFKEFSFLQHYFKRKADLQEIKKMD